MGDDFKFGLSPAGRRSHLELDRRIRALEGSGWHPLGSGDQTSLTFAVPSGTKRVRVSWRAVGTTNANITLVVNGDTGSNYTRYQSRNTPAGVFSGALDGTTGGAGFIGECVGTQPAWGEFTVYSDDGSFFGVSWHSGTPTGSKQSEQFNIYTPAVAVTSLTMGVNVGSLTAFDWVAEGFFP